MNRHFDLQNDHLLRSPSCNRQIQQRKQDRRFSKPFCHAVIDAKPHELYIKMRQIYSFVQIWRYICYSKHALSNKPSFPRCIGFPAGQAFKNLHQTHVRKCKNAMPKSRQNLSSLLSIVDYIFYNLFLVVHLRKKYYFGKEKQYSTQNGVFLERFNRKSGSPDSLYGKCRNDFDMSLLAVLKPHVTNKMPVCDKLYQCVACGLLSTILDTFIHAVLLQIVTVSLKIDDPV